MNVALMTVAEAFALKLIEIMLGTVHDSTRAHSSSGTLCRSSTADAPGLFRSRCSSRKVSVFAAVVWS